MSFSEYLVSIKKSILNNGMLEKGALFTDILDQHK